MFIFARLTATGAMLFAVWYRCDWSVALLATYLAAQMEWFGIGLGRVWHNVEVVKEVVKEGVNELSKESKTYDGIKEV